MISLITILKIGNFTYVDLFQECISFCFNLNMFMLTRCLLSLQTMAVMDQFHKKTLLRKRPNLVNRLEPDKILDYLLAEEVFDKADYEKIRSFPTSQEQSRQLLDILVLRGSTAYPCFLQALKDGKAKELAEELEKQERYPFQFIRS